MLEIFQQLSDDQTALLGCGAAMIGAMFMLMLSFHTNPKNREDLVKNGSEKLSEQEKVSENRPRRAA